MRAPELGRDWTLPSTPSHFEAGWEVVWGCQVWGSPCHSPGLWLSASEGLAVSRSQEDARFTVLGTLLGESPW